MAGVIYVLGLTLWKKFSVKIDLEFIKTLARRYWRAAENHDAKHLLSVWHMHMYIYHTLPPHHNEDVYHL